MVLVGGVCFFIGRTAGQVSNLQAALLDESGSVDIERVINLYSSTRSSDINFDQYWDVWDMIQEKYVHEDIDTVALFYQSIQGMVEGLDDPYSVYFPPTEAKAFAEGLSGEFEGIGAEIAIRDNQLIVVAPLPASPAEQAGLQPSDVIVAIDGEDTFDITVEEAVSRIRGPKSTTVVLSILRDGASTIQEISVIRDTIEIPTVHLERESTDPTIAYVRINYFNQDTWREFHDVVTTLLADRPQGIILDLRSNPGGYLETSVDVASEWITEGAIVLERERGGVETVFTTRGQHRLAGIPTVVLVDEGTASGSEIVAGALQDSGAATIMGAQTFGKGSVQDFQILPDGSAIKLTIAEWLTPSERVINNVGITPDIVIDTMFATSTDEVIDLGRAQARDYLQLN